MTTRFARVRFRPGPTSRRWLRVSALSVVAAVAIELLSPTVWHYLVAAQRQYSPPLILVVAWTLFVIALYVAIGAMRIRWSQRRSFKRHPPLWFVVPLGWLLAVASELLPAEIRPRPIAANWSYVLQAVFYLSATGVAVVFRCFLREEVEERQKTISATSSQGITTSAVMTWISSGDGHIERSEQDLLNHEPIARRIARTVVTEKRSVALLGPFGSGKTSIVNMARAELDCHTTRPPIVATVAIWAVPTPEDVSRFVLHRIVAALECHIDTLGLRTLPRRYQRLVAAKPTRWLFRALGFDSTTDPVDTIRKIDPLLAVLDTRLVLIVQDVERTGKSIDTRNWYRLLWALRDLEHASFILAIDPKRADSDCKKLCDSIEIIPELEVRPVAKILQVAYRQWRNDYNDIDPHDDRERGGFLGLGDAPIGGIEAYCEIVRGDSPLAAIVALVRTPRALRHILRSVDSAWRKLHGEVELDDLIIVSILRHSAEPAYRFLVGNVDALRQEPSDLMTRTHSVKDDWKKEVEAMQESGAVRMLVIQLGFRQIRQDVGGESPQGVHLSAPTDYFRRILAGEMDPAEIRDQTVLRDLKRWQEERDETLVTQLVAATGEDPQYARVWNHFADRHTQRELMALTQVVVARVLDRDGTEADGAHPALIRLWRACSRRFSKGQVGEWVRDLILSAVPTSLHLVVDLYGYWTGQGGVVTDAERADIGKAIIRAVRNGVRAGRDLTRVLVPEHPYSVWRLITRTDVGTGRAAYSEWKDYWPGVLVEGARLEPEIVVPELAILAGDEQSGRMALEPEYPPVFLRRYKIDRERMTALCGDRLDEVLALLAEYDGENPYAVRAKQDAAEWLNERDAEDEGT